MSNIIYFLVLFIFAFTPLKAGHEKIDPLFFAYTASDSLGEMIDFELVSDADKFISNPMKSDDGYLHFDNVIQKNNLGETAVIVKGSQTAVSSYLSEMTMINESIFTGYAGYSEILQMAENPEIKFIEMSKPMFQSADSGAYYTRIGTMSSYGFTGKNVILGFIDEGFSPDEFCFYKDGKSNFKTVWNQHFMRLPSPDGFCYGEELDSTSFLTYHIEDNTGHGTSILSILAARNSLDALVGDASIIGVSCIPTTKGVLDGFKYIESRATAVNKPFAIILPMNHFWGSHDGRGLLEESINEMFRSDKIKRGLSVPVGNLGNMLLHAQSDLYFSDTLHEITENQILIAQSVKNYSLDIDVMIEGGIYIRFLLKDKEGLWKSSWIDIEQTKIGYCKNSVSYIGFGFNEELSQLHIVLNQENYSLLGIEFSAKENLSSIECYAAQGGYFLQTSVYPHSICGDMKKTIASPALASQAISSAGYVSRRKTTESLISPDTIFHILNWSGRAGEGIVKPDLYSPGKYIFAYGKGLWGVVLNDTVSAFQGTSYAAAFTGAALIQLLQSDTFLDVSKLYSQLKNGADVVPVELNRGEYTPSYGFLNVYNSLKSQTVLSSICRVSTFSIGDTSVGICLSDKSMTIESIEKNKNAGQIILKEKYFAIDKKPYLGKNIYVLTVKDIFGNKTTETVLFILSSQHSNEPVAYFDLTGRLVDKRFFKQGVLFEKQNKKVKKIVKF
ncbi:MAG: hypothetical protein AB7T10_04890 [bacterium]